MHELAVMLETGEGADAGIEKNEQQALRWYTRAARLEHVSAAEAAQRLAERLQNTSEAAVLIKGEEGLSIHCNLLLCAFNPETRSLSQLSRGNQEMVISIPLT